MSNPPQPPRLIATGRTEWLICRGCHRLVNMTVIRQPDGVGVTRVESCPRCGHELRIGGGTG